MTSRFVLRSVASFVAASATSFALSGCGLGGDADVGDDRAKVDNGGSATGGASSSGTGGAQSAGSGGSENTATGGSGAGDPCLQAALCVQGYAWNSKDCRCEPAQPAPEDAGVACPGPEAVTCPVDYTWNQVSCACEPNAPTPVDAGTHCTIIALCIQGYVWNEATCSCVPDGNAGSCATDADCRLVDDYCGGCNCYALGPGETVPQCHDVQVQCFAAPCLNKTAACVNGACVAN